MNLSFNQYRAIDLTILAILLGVSEAMIAMAAYKWFPLSADYTVSPMVAMVCIVMMRWDKFAVMHCMLSGLVYCIVAAQTPEQYAVYIVGNCGALLALIVLKAAGKQRVAQNGFFTIIYIVTAYAGAQIGRWIVAMIFGGNVWDIVRFVTTDIISLLFSVVVVMIARKPDGLFEDQKAYLIRMDQERREEQRLHDHDDFAD